MTTTSTNVRFVNVFRGSTNQTVPDTSWTTVLFNGVLTDGENNVMYTPSNGNFIAPQSGWYEIEAQISWTAGLIGSIRVVKNGDVNHPVCVRTNTVGQSNNYIKYRGFMGTNETLQIQVRQTLGSANILASLDPSSLGQPGITTTAHFTLIKPSPSVSFNGF